MIQALVLDTSAYSSLLRSNLEVIAIIATAKTLLIPLVVVGELRAGFIKGSRNGENESKLTAFMAQNSTEVTTIEMTTTQQFAELIIYAKSRGKSLSHNDLWIAAIAQETNSSLVTLDQDFAVFEPLMGERLLICST